MKKLMLCLMLMLVVGGCTNAFWDPETDTIIGKTAYEALTPDEQAKYEGVQIVDPDIAAKIDAGAAATQGVVTVMKPLIPEPFASGSLAVIAGLIGLWGYVKNAKIKTKFDAVKLGALMTAESVETVIKPVAETWTAFKAAQKAKELTAIESGKTVIMPDRITG